MKLEIKFGTLVGLLISLISILFLLAVEIPIYSFIGIPASQFYLAVSKLIAYFIIFNLIYGLMCGAFFGFIYYLIGNRISGRPLTKGIKFGFLIWLVATIAILLKMAFVPTPAGMLYLNVKFTVGLEDIRRFASFVIFGIVFVSILERTKKLRS
jgi:hypothetical protein